jgi:uncharacterized protein YecT (DUF1311 family)
MKLLVLLAVVLASSVVCYPQTALRDINPSELQAVLDLPLNQAVRQRTIYKEPLTAAYNRQIAMTDKDCRIESEKGQQPYNICMGHAEEQANEDFAIFYNNLQVLCHDQFQLKTLQASLKAWRTYQDSAMKATRAAWSGGSGASGFAAQVYLSLLRNYMRELHEIFGLNIAQ